MSKEFLIYRDKGKEFECDVKVKGAKLSETRARLILNFNDGLSLLYNGQVDLKGNCKINIPPIKEITDSDAGTLILEVIADSTVFEPWKSMFVVSQFQDVIVEVTEHEPEKPKVSVITEVKIDDIEELEPSERDLRVKKAVEIFMKRATPKRILKEVKRGALTKESLLWASRVYGGKLTGKTSTAAKLYSIISKNHK